MSVNRFERLVEETQGQTRQFIAGIVEREAKRVAISDLQTALDDRHEGTDPSKVWGESVGVVCAEFLEFAGNHALPPTDISHRVKTGMRKVGGILFKTEVPVYENDWEMTGYPLGYSESPDVLIGKHTRGGIGVETKGDSPSQDIFLCVDGLLRRRDKALEVVDCEGTPRVPHVGLFEWYIAYSYNKTADASWDWSGTINTYKLKFTEMSVEDYLSKLVLLSTH